MQWILIPLIIIAAGLVLFSLARGLYYFAKASDSVANGDGPSAMHLKQNQMMFARVKWQAITIILLVIVGLVAANG